MMSGFSTKSKAPSLVALTAVSTVPWPEIMTTGRSHVALPQPLERLEPSMPGQPDVEQDHVGR